MILCLSLLSILMSYPSSLSDYWHSLQWSSLTDSFPTDPRACLSSISASSFCCLPYLPFWPFSRFTDYNDLDVDDDISTSSSTWQPPPSALSSFSSAASSASSLVPPPPSSSFPASSYSSSSSSSLSHVSQPVAQPVFSSHLVSSTFSSPDQLASILVRQDEYDSRREKGDRDRRRKEDDRAAHALSSDMRSSRDGNRSSTSHKAAHSSNSSKKGKKRSHREKGRDKDRKRRGEEMEKGNRPAVNVPRSALSSSPPHSIHQDEDMSDSDLSSDDDELRLGGDRHERALVGSVGKPAAIY